MGKHEISTLCVTKPQDYRHSPTIQIIQKTKQNDSYYEGGGAFFIQQFSHNVWGEERVFDDISFWDRPRRYSGEARTRDGSTIQNEGRLQFWLTNDWGMANYHIRPEFLFSCFYKSVLFHFEQWGNEIVRSYCDKLTRIGYSSFGSKVPLFFVVVVDHVSIDRSKWMKTFLKPAIQEENNSIIVST